MNGLDMQPRAWVLALAGGTLLYLSGPFVFGSLILNFIGGVVGKPLTAIAGAALFAGFLFGLKQRVQLAYGLVELILASLTVAVASIQAATPTGNPVVALIAFMSGLYVTVRGLENVKAGAAKLSLEKPVETVILDDDGERMF